MISGAGGPDDRQRPGRRPARCCRGNASTYFGFRAAGWRTFTIASRSPSNQGRTIPLARKHRMSPRVGTITPGVHPRPAARIVALVRPRRCNHRRYRSPAVDQSRSRDCSTSSRASGSGNPRCGEHSLRLLRGARQVRATRSGVRAARSGVRVRGAGCGGKAGFSRPPPPRPPSHHHPPPHPFPRSRSRTPAHPAPFTPRGGRSGQPADAPPRPPRRQPLLVGQVAPRPPPGSPTPFRFITSSAALAPGTCRLKHFHDPRSGDTQNDGLRSGWNGQTHQCRPDPSIFCGSPSNSAATAARSTRSLKDDQLSGPFRGWERRRSRHARPPRPPRPPPPGGGRSTAEANR